MLPEFASLLTQGSDFIAEAALDFNASLDGVSLKSGDFTTLTKGSVSLRRGQSRKGADLSKPLPLFASSAEPATITKAWSSSTGSSTAMMAPT